MTLSASQIVLEYVCPAAGTITGQLMWLAPFQAIRKAVREGSLGDLNPLPWAFMLGNCIGWVTYSIIIDNYFVYFANITGFLLAIWYNLQAVKLQYSYHRSTELRHSIVSALQDQSQSFLPSNGDVHQATTGAESLSPLDYAKIVWDVAAQNTTPAPIVHEVFLFIMVFLWTGIISLLSFADSFSKMTRENIVGIVVICNLVFFYGAPLSTIFQVLKERSSATIHIPTMLTNTFNGTFWCAYGIAISDWFIAGPNGIGAVLGGIQILLCFVLPRQHRQTTTAGIQETDEVEPTQQELPNMPVEKSSPTDVVEELSASDPEAPEEESIRQALPSENDFEQAR